MSGSLTEQAIDDFLAGTKIVCEQNTNVKQMCTYGDINIDGCKNVNLSCGQDAKVTVLGCENDDMINLATEVVSKRVEGDQAAKDAIMKYLVQSRNAKPDTDINQALKSYFSAKCSQVVIADQNVAIDKVTLTGKCDNTTVLAYNKLNLSAKCALASLTSLMKKAGLSQPITDGPGSASPKPAPAPVTVPVYVWIIVGLVVFCIVAGMIYFATQKAKKKT